MYGTSSSSTSRPGDGVQPSDRSRSPHKRRTNPQKIVDKTDTGRKKGTRKIDRNADEAPEKEEMGRLKKPESTCFNRKKRARDFEKGAQGIKM